MYATTIAVDLAKSVFQVSIANRIGKITDRKRLTRSQFERLLATHPQSEVVMEACATSNFWSQYAQAHGHQTRLIHARYVKPFVRRNKTDAADADALVQANKDPQITSVPTKQPEQQALQSIHRCRQHFIKTRTRRINLARALLAEFGLALPRGSTGISQRLMEKVEALPEVAMPTLSTVIQSINELVQQEKAIDAQLKTLADQSEDCGYLMSIPGVGVIVATAMIASVPDIHAFKNARCFSAWLGITPREYSSGNKRRIGAISKQGDPYLRTMLVHGARSAILQAHRQAAKDATQLSNLQHWILRIRERRPFNVATLAVANKLARLIYVMWTEKRDYIK